MKSGGSAMPASSEGTVTEPVRPLDLRARLLIDGVWTDGFETFDVTDKYTGERIGCADRASRAMATAHANCPRCRCSGRLCPG